jgi:hypothetical protein
MVPNYIIMKQHLQFAYAIAWIKTSKSKLEKYQEYNSKYLKVRTQYSSLMKRNVVLSYKSTIMYT